MTHAIAATGRCRKPVYEVAHVDGTEIAIASAIGMCLQLEFCVVRLRLAFVSCDSI